MPDNAPMLKAARKNRGSLVRAHTPGPSRRQGTGRRPQGGCWRKSRTGGTWQTPGGTAKGMCFNNPDPLNYASALVHARHTLPPHNTNTNAHAGSMGSPVSFGNPVSVHGLRLNTAARAAAKRWTKFPV
eukprot:Tamp_37278.p1 GENE.Tamp_37278~~Tamp_37278.p1  ORF type:complete len:129 (-),score=2.28 Tamp_37278:22-408(-)